MLRARAVFDGPEHSVHVRVAEHEGNLYLDLGDPAWRAVEISAAGWRTVTDPPVHFRRPSGLLALPEPIRGGSVDELRPFVNIASDDDFRLLLSWLVAALSPGTPFPVLVLGGEQGAAKSTVARVVRLVLDPNAAPLRAEPREVRDLMIAATNGWTVVLDNLSTVPTWLSDAICRLATGGGFATRELYSDGDEVLFDAMRPVVLNGITELATRGDLLDRSLVLTLPPIAETERRAEAELWSAFEAAQPRILGALLDALALALRDAEHVELSERPRMVDFAQCAAAAAPALGWTAADFLSAYTGNREGASASALEASPVVQVLLDYVAECGAFEGTATMLLAELDGRFARKTRQSRDWPKAPRALTNALRRLAPNLRSAGVDVTFERDTTRRRNRVVRLVPLEMAGNVASAASAASAPNLSVADEALDETGGLRPAASNATPEPESAQDAADVADASVPAPRGAAPRRGQSGPGGHGATDARISASARQQRAPDRPASVPCASGCGEPVPREGMKCHPCASAAVRTGGARVQSSAEA
ncbi:MAG: hypothetical protein QF664_13895 [Dehalococcoidia bacterium]|nr:hypothetical protein [Dehalococcoidia bacterium]